MPIPKAVQHLTPWIAPQLPSKTYIHKHQKVSHAVKPGRCCSDQDAELIAIAVLRILHKVPYFSPWWSQIKINFLTYLPSLTQAYIRLRQLTQEIEKMAGKPHRVLFCPRRGAS